MKENPTSMPRQAWFLRTEGRIAIVAAFVGLVAFGVWFAYVSSLLDERLMNELHGMLVGHSRSRNFDPFGGGKAERLCLCMVTGMILLARSRTKEPAITLGWVVACAFVFSALAPGTVVLSGFYGALLVGGLLLRQMHPVALLFGFPIVTWAIYDLPGRGSFDTRANSMYFLLFTIAGALIAYIRDRRDEKSESVSAPRNEITQEGLTNETP